MYMIFIYILIIIINIRLCNKARVDINKVSFNKSTICVFVAMKLIRI